MENRTIIGRKIISLILIILGIGFVIGGFFLFYLLIIGIGFVIGGALLWPRFRDSEISEIVKKKKNSKQVFIAGTIVTAISLLILMLELGMGGSAGWFGIISSYLGLPLYSISVLLVAYSIHLSGNKWGWLDLPIALLVCSVAFNKIMDYPYPWEVANRLPWLLVFPLNYIPILILYIVVYRKSSNKE